MKTTKAQALTRQHRRAELDIYVNKIIGDEPHMVRVRDISEGGLYLYKLLEPSLEAEGQVGLELKLPHTDEIIWAVGEVVREDADRLTDGVAIRFVRIAESDRQLISEYVAARVATRAA
jgi:hypothetical protein